MDAKKARALTKNWGDKPCNHPSIDKEYDAGSSTGDYICTQCGQVIDKDEWKKEQEKNE